MEKHNCVRFVWDPDILLNKSIKNKLKIQNDLLIRNEQELKNLNYDEIEVIFIQAELKWEGYRRQDLYGLEIAKKIRIENQYLGPLIICSPLSEESIYQLNSETATFLNSPCTYYCSLNTIECIDYDSLEFIDEDTLFDIRESFGNLKNIIDNVIHDIKNKFIDLTVFKDEKTKKSDLEKIVEPAFVKLLLYFPNDKPLIKKARFEFVDVILQETTNESVNYSISQLKSLLYKLLPYKAEEGQIKSYDVNWKILFLDDEEIVRGLLEKKFTERGFVCETAKNKDELYQKLQEDEKYNLFSVLICDYRLKRPDSEKWEDMQGYNILKEIFLKKQNFLSLLALSSMEDKLMMRISERYNMKVRSFTKDDVKTDSGFNIFCTNVYEEGQKMFNTICGLPNKDFDFKAWDNPNKDKRDKPFKEYYRMHRMSKSFVEDETRIGCEAKKFYLNVMKGSEIVAHKFEFTSALIGDDEAKKMEKFLNKLIGRRIYLALRFKGKINKPEEIWKLMQNKTKTDTLKKIDPSTLFSQNLCMPEDFEKQVYLLPEEKYWMQNELGYDFDSVIHSALNDIYDVIDNYLELKQKKAPTNSKLKELHLFVRDIGEVFSLMDVKKILLRFDNIENQQEHKNAIFQRINDETKKIVENMKKVDKNTKLKSQSIYQGYAISGILDLIKDWKKPIKNSQITNKKV